MKPWRIEYGDAVEKDFRSIGHVAAVRVRKLIGRVALNPLPTGEGGYGKPLGNTHSSKLAGCLKIKLKSLGIRVVYRIHRENEIMKIIIISVRADDEVYKDAERRIAEFS